MATSAGRNTFSQWQTCVSLTLPVLCTHECSSCCTCRVGPSKHAIHWPNIGTSFHHESSRCVRSYEIPSSPISFSRKKTTAFAIPRATESSLSQLSPSGQIIRSCADQNKTATCRQSRGKALAKMQGPWMRPSHIMAEVWDLLKIVVLPLGDLHP